MINKARLDATDVINASTPAHTSTAKGIPALIEKFVIRLPNGLRTQIKELSENNRRSMNSEIIMVLEKHIQQNLSNTDMSEFKAELTDKNISSDAMKEIELKRKLESLPNEKKEALLELLG